MEPENYGQKRLQMQKNDDKGNPPPKPHPPQRHPSNIPDSINDGIHRRGYDEPPCITPPHPWPDPEDSGDHKRR